MLKSVGILTHFRNEDIDPAVLSLERNTGGGKHNTVTTEIAAWKQAFGVIVKVLTVHPEFMYFASIDENAIMLVQTFM